MSGGSLQRLAALQRNLPEYVVQRQDQPGFGFRELQQSGIRAAWTIGRIWGREPNPWVRLGRFIGDFVACPRNSVRPLW